MNAPAIAMITTRLIGLVSLVLGVMLLAAQVLPLMRFLQAAQLIISLNAAQLSLGERVGLNYSAIGAGATGVIVGWYLLCRGKRVHRYLLAGLGHTCTRCGYNIRGCTGSRCPECGEELLRLGLR